MPKIKPRWTRKKGKRRVKKNSVAGPSDSKNINEPKTVSMELEPVASTCVNSKEEPHAAGCLPENLETITTEKMTLVAEDCNEAKNNSRFPPLTMPPKIKPRLNSKKGKRRVKKNSVSGPSDSKNINEPKTVSMELEPTNFTCVYLKEEPLPKNLETITDKEMTLCEDCNEAEKNSEIIVHSIMDTQGNKMLVVNRHVFTSRGILADGTLAWMCDTEECSARCYTAEDDTIVDSSLTHNHPLDLQKLSRLTVISLRQKGNLGNTYKSSSSNTMHLSPRDKILEEETITEYPLITTESLLQQTDDTDGTYEGSSLPVMQEGEDVTDNMDIKDEPLNIKKEFDDLDNSHYSDIDAYLKKCSHNEEVYRLIKNVATAYTSFKNSETRKTFTKKIEELISEMKILDDIKIEDLK